MRMPRARTCTCTCTVHPKLALHVSPLYMRGTDPRDPVCILGIKWHHDGTKMAPKRSLAGLQKDPHRAEKYPCHQQHV